MSKQEIYNTTVTRVGTVLHTDKDPIDQPKGTHRFALNAINETSEGGQNNISNEKSAYDCSNLPEGFVPNGDRYIEDDTIVVILVNPTTGYEQIGLIQKDDIYITLVETKVLGLKVTHQCDIRYRLRRGNERVIYWVNGDGFAKTFNLDRLHNFHNITYQDYLKAGGDPNTFLTEKWDASSFDLRKSYTFIPFFSNITVLETGSTLPGSYNFAIQYVDEDLNPTEWITTSNTVNIYNDTTTAPYHRVRGSRNVQNDAQNFPRASKSIKLTITNLDSSFPYYRIAIIRAAGNTGLPEKVLASDLQPTSDSNFVYAGNDSQLTEIQLGDILIDGQIIFSPNHIEQLENKLLLANTKGKGMNWCDFQKFASKIRTDLVTKEVLLNNIQSEPNVKNAKSTFMFHGYMPGEVESFGINYVFRGGYISPTFHVPGKSPLDTTSKMKVYENESSRYLDVHNCATENYWGRDYLGNTLVGKKVRHHRFPFRKDVNKPLYTTTGTTNNLNKYRLKVVITLNPSFTPSPSYPLDTNNDPIPISYIFNYQVNGAISTDSFSGTLTNSDVGQVIYIYDDVTALNQVYLGNTQYAELEPTSELGTYQPGTNNRFIITFTYEPYVASTSFNDDRAEIFGIEFFNIEKPHPDVIGFYIVRNERTDDDKIIIDNAIFGAMTEFDQYKSFGMIMPKRFYQANNCGIIGNSGKTLNYYKQGTWFFNPEFQYYNKKVEFDTVEIEGTYTQTSVNMPTISNVNGSTCNYGATRGVYIEDVQAGTSYNPDVHKKKDKDDDGFDLLIGYKNTNVSYSINNTLVFPVKKQVIYLNAASYKNFENNIFYNTSVDNKIGEYIVSSDIDINNTFNSTGNVNKLQYGSLVKNNTTAYANFINRPYYKEHNNPIYFGSNNIINGAKIFNGDTQISAFNFVSSVFYDMVVGDRAKKSKVWKIVIGAVLVVAAIAATIVTAGAAAPIVAPVVASALITLAISYGVSLVMSGIKFEQFKAMIDTDYEKGLKETVVDGGIFETVRDTLGGKDNDDTIRWFSDRVSNIYIESSVPFGLRAGLTSGVPDFIDAPVAYDETGFRNYLIEKYTALDRDQGSGRMYKGYATAEYYDMNLDYTRFNKQKQYSHLAIEYDCCSDPNEIFPTRIWDSAQSFQEEKIDNYRVFPPNNYRDIEGEHGEITGLYRLGNALFILTKEALWQLPQNVQERVTNEVVSFIGTGSFFSIPPRKVLDDNLGSGGTQHKWAVIKTNKGVMYISEVESKIYLHTDRLKDVTEGNRNWFETNLKPFLSKQLFDKFFIKYPHSNNPANSNGTGYLSTYDTRYERVIFTKRDWELLPDKLAILELRETKPTSFLETAFVYAKDDGLFYLGNKQITFDDVDYFENKSWTISYSFHMNGFISWHSYLPNYYIHSQNSLYSVLNGRNKISKHHREGHFQTFYNKYSPFLIEYIKLANLVDQTFEDFTIQTIARKYSLVDKQYYDERFVTFNKLVIYNTRQSSGEQIIKVKDTQNPEADWYKQQTVNRPGVILAARIGRNWNINDLRDYVTNYDKPLFTRKWSAVKDSYFIDKVVNPDAVSFQKPWEDLQNFRDKYIVIRLKFDSFNDVNLLLNYSLETEQLSVT